MVEMTEELIALWGMMMQDVDYLTAANNLKAHMLTSKYPPTIAEIAAPNSRYDSDRRKAETSERLALITGWSNSANLPAGRRDLDV